MNAMFRMSWLALGATAAIALFQPASAQTAASACAIPAARLLPDAADATPTSLRSTLLRRHAHVRAYVDCLRAHGARPASSRMAAAARGNIVTFDVPGSISTNPAAINSVGTIVGWYVDTYPVTHSFERSPGGAVTTFDPPGATGGSATNAINAEGAITGYSCDGSACHGFLHSRGGGFVIFDPPGSNGLTIPVAIRPAGEIVGFYFDASFAPHGFVRAVNGVFTVFDPPGGPIDPDEFYGFGNAMAVNAEDAITASFCPDPSCGVVHGFVRTAQGSFAAFDPQGSVWTNPSSINARGEIVGFYNDASALGHGFLRDPGGAITAFDVPNTIFYTYANSVHDSGTIAGVYGDATLQRALGFLRTQGGAYTVFEPPGNLFVQNAAINSAGVVAGSFADSSGNMHGFVRTP